MEILIDSIEIPKTRFRKDLGDIERLALSMKVQGLFQQIGVTSDHVLVWGARRVEAARSLGWETIEAKIVPDDMDLLHAEFSENEIRQDFTTTERVAIGRALEESMGERRGRPGKDGKISGFSGETRVLAAKVAGFGNERTYSQAKDIDESEHEDIKDAVDAGEMSIYKGHQEIKRRNLSPDYVKDEGREAVLHFTQALNRFLKEYCHEGAAAILAEHWRKPIHLADQDDVLTRAVTFLSELQKRIKLC